MKAENFIAFFTVCGFFIGMLFTLIKVYEPIDMLVYTLLITFFFYLVIHIVIMNYVDVRRTMKLFFDKERHEEIADYLISELAIREKRMENVILKVATADKNLGKNNVRTKAKAA
ncbi:hypothetical protein KDE13_01250 [Campylobacter sp. faydin G-140]|uniref:hypothetical protein n=1 Tax=Campylobacter anatolicus TaxID=2829105 RepID=UPI001B959737|nr:hypothetical protein [Campylobacter anatolicus]MBR8461921.1 hypothetical protein [Campylobacter anatolicus]MBR8464988.1 hypothetical protein [Campylobacter anatolicus]